MGAGSARRVACSAATWSIVGGSARVVDHVGPRVLVARRIRFNHVPGKQREYLVEARVAAQVGVVEVGVAPVAEPDVCRYQRQAGFVGVPNTVAIGVKEAAGVDVRLPLVYGNIA